ncbi:MAG: 50S ribosomal protein L18, partial [bacterium]|nr:50S ribosomal protein L18 [bacterium]
RQKVFGTKSRPRLSVYRSLKHIYAQVINDEEGRTLCGASSLKIEKSGLSKVEVAKIVGNLIAKEAISRDIKEVTFDRGGYLYHGRVKSLAEGAREGGLHF